METTIDWGNVLLWLVTLMGIGLVLVGLMVAWVFYKVRRINLPAGADFFEALRMTPLSVVILLDLLDFSLDFLSAPFAWVILSRLGLQPLRAVSMVQSLIPGTVVIPAMTLSWILARVWKGARLPANLPNTNTRSRF